MKLKLFLIFLYTTSAFGCQNSILTNPTNTTSYARSTAITPTSFVSPTLTPSPTTLPPTKIIPTTTPEKSPPLQSTPTTSFDPYTHKLYDNCTYKSCLFFSPNNSVPNGIALIQGYYSYSEWNIFGKIAAYDSLTVRTEQSPLSDNLIAQIHGGGDEGRLIIDITKLSDAEIRKLKASHKNNLVQVLVLHEYLSNLKNSNSSVHLVVLRVL